MKAKANRKFEVESGKWVTAPAPGLVPLFQRLGGVEVYNRATNTFAFNDRLLGTYALPEVVANRHQMVADYNAGVRWV